MRPRRPHHAFTGHARHGVLCRCTRCRRRLKQFISAPSHRPQENGSANRPSDYRHSRRCGRCACDYRDASRHASAPSGDSATPSKSQCRCCSGRASSAGSSCGSCGKRGCCCSFCCRSNRCDTDSSAHSSPYRCTYPTSNNLTNFQDASFSHFLKNSRFCTADLASDHCGVRPY